MQFREITLMRIMNGGSMEQSFYLLILVYLALWVDLSIQNGSLQTKANLLESGNNMAKPADQPELSFDTFKGPGSSEESEIAKPFNNVPGAPSGSPTSNQAKPSQDSSKPLEELITPGSKIPSENAIQPIQTPWKPFETFETTEEPNGGTASESLRPGAGFCPLKKIIKAMMEDFAERNKMADSMLNFEPQPSQIGLLGLRPLRLIPMGFGMRRFPGFRHPQRVRWVSLD